MEEYDFCNITELASPVGIFTVKYQEKRIPFSIKKNNFDIPVEVYDSENRNVVAMLQTETNYALSIDLNNLEVGRTYKISFSGGNLKRFDSDEHTEALTTTKMDTLWELECITQMMMKRLNNQFVIQNRGDFIHKK